MRTTIEATVTSVHRGDVDIHAETRGSGPDVLLIAGLGDTLEAWQLQLEGLAAGYRLTAYDNRGVGRTPLPPGPLSVEQLADDAAAVLRATANGPAHVAGFSGGACFAQELALRHPDLVRSLVLVSTWTEFDARTQALVDGIRWMSTSAPSERAFVEAFFAMLYTTRAHDSGWVAAVIDEALQFPFPPDPDAIPRTLDAHSVHSTGTRLHQVGVPTLVIGGGQDLITPPHLGRQVADRIAGAVFEIWETEAHQPFQEVPERFNERVDTFWQSVR